MATYATVDDVRARFEGDIPEGSSTERVVTARLDDAEAMVIHRLGGADALAARIEAGRTTAALVTMVLCNMVLRLLRNASGVTQETAGPFSRSFDSAVAAGKLYLTKDDRRDLGMRGQAGTISLSEADDALRHPHRRDWRAGLPDWIA
ncbi:Gp19/Gp15/Gp42 family protein [Nocardiopsis dassonvillei]|uniref:Gp19/Gp15/Gp42 family protein n=1 Tax=Nocardiopsis dassonvillei TaxID=2014 RepID=UPI0033D7C5A8